MSHGRQDMEDRWCNLCNHWKTEHADWCSLKRNDIKHTDTDAPQAAQIKSDGGSSSYYTLNINGNVVETEHIISQVFGNDFDYGNAFKSLVRAYQASKGRGKAGNDINYEMNKIKYSADKIKGRK